MQISSLKNCSNTYNKTYPIQTVPSHAHVRLAAFGSYRLGVHSTTSDIDVLCLAPLPVTREMFFIGMRNALQTQQHVSELIVSFVVFCAIGISLLSRSHSIRFYTSLHLSTPLYTSLHLSTPLYTVLHCSALYTLLGGSTSLSHTYITHTKRTLTLKHTQHAHTSTQRAHFLLNIPTRRLSLMHMYQWSSSSYSASKW